jgi:hypothetical protein
MLLAIWQQKAKNTPRRLSPWIGLSIGYGVFGSKN